MKQMKKKMFIFIMSIVLGLFLYSGLAAAADGAVSLNGQPIATL